MSRYGACDCGLPHLTKAERQSLQRCVDRIDHGVSPFAVGVGSLPHIDKWRTAMEQRWERPSNGLLSMAVNEVEQWP